MTAQVDRPLLCHWSAANRALIAKMIGELTYEGVLAPTEDGPQRCLDLGSAGVWRFRARDNLWGQPMIKPESLVPPEGVELDAAGFFLALRPWLEMSEDQVAEHMQDLFTTLRADCQLREARRGLSADEAIRLPEPARQALLDGHPKFLFNKGRRGWGLDALYDYAPEYGGAFRLGWVAAWQGALEHGGDPIDAPELLEAALDDAEHRRLRRALAESVADPTDYCLLPVHPWQWQRWLAPLYAGEIARGRLAYLGTFGDEFVAQQSLRTLTNHTRPAHYDVKLPLTIMNTSCYRGIPARFLLAGADASQWLKDKAHADSELAGAQLEILAEPAGAVLPHPHFARLEEAPYRYHELFGVIWREGLTPRLGAEEHGLLMAELMQSDEHGRSWLGAYMAAAGVSNRVEAERWLTRMFEVTVVPLWHLLCRYGVSLIAHGQNLTLILRLGWPARLALKDFQGDLRLVDEDFPEAADLPASIKAAAARLPADKLMHDLQTGHFVTTLRFIAPLWESVGVSERRFYELCAQVLLAYRRRHPELAQRCARFDLLAPRMRRLTLNRAKFVHATDASSARMLADMQEFIDNPLHLASGSWTNRPDRSTEVLDA